MNRGDLILVAFGIACTIALILYGNHDGYWVFGVTAALAFASVWLTPWLWLNFLAYGFTIAPADREEAAAVRSAARLVLRIGIPVWLAEIAYLSMPSVWTRFDVGWLVAVAQLATPIIAVSLGFRANAARKKRACDAGASAAAQADSSSSRTP